MKNLLFICSQNKLRSPTAESVFCDYPNVEADSAGVNDCAEIPVSPEHLEWADLIFCMEKVHRQRLNRKFGKYLAGKRIIILNIPDNYAYMDEDLVRILKQKCAQYF